jgi:hypothetical protein
LINGHLEIAIKKYRYLFQAGVTTSGSVVRKIRSVSHATVILKMGKKDRKVRRWERKIGKEV